MGEERNFWTRRRISRRAALRGTGLGLAGLAGAALIGCGDDDEAAPSARATTAPAAGTASPQATAAPPPVLTDATLTSAIASDMGSGDPQSLAGTGGGNWPNTSTHFGGANLLETDPVTGARVGALAESWEVLDEGAGYRFTLRPGVTFHNGEALTAESVKFSVDRTMGLAAYNPDFKGGHAGQLTPRLESVDVVDERTVIFNIKKRDVAFPFRTDFRIVPQGYIERVGDTEFANNPVGAGMFKFVSHSVDSEIVSERFDDFYRAAGSGGAPHVPYIKRLVQKVIPDSQARYAAFQAGEIDLMHNVSSDLARELQSDADATVHYLPGTQPMHIKINTSLATDPETGEPNPWLDPRVRKAANLAIDLDAIIENILTGAEVPSYGVSSKSLGFPSGIEKDRWGFDPAEAKRLLTAAGHPDGFDAKLIGPSGRWPNSRPVMEAIGQYLTDVGIRTPIQELSYAVVTQQIKDDSLYPLIFFGASGSSEPGYALAGAYRSTGNYNMSMVIPDTDDMISLSEQEFDSEQRAVLLSEVVRKLYLEDVQVIYLYEPVTVVVTKKNWQWDIWGTSISNPEYWNIRPVEA